MKKNAKNESAKASKRNQSTWKIDVTSKGNTKIRGKNENVANTNITVNINVAQNSDIKTKCIVGEMLRVHSYLKYKDDLQQEVKVFYKIDNTRKGV